MERCDQHPFWDLTWPECAQLCKQEHPSEAKSLRFAWGPTDHVLRRFLTTNALPELEEITVYLSSWDDGPLRLFERLESQGRGLKKMGIETTFDLWRKKHVRYELERAADGQLKATARMLSGQGTEEQIRRAAKSFGIDEWLAR